MSETNKTFQGGGKDRRYAEWWEPTLAFILVLIMLVTLFVVHRSQLRDLQRRIALLEQNRPSQ